jgi:hypothetical protein|tara:strand:- start:14018 stop:14419 length:402 start_codon:yes stop_codon:yes gene_type:complete
MSILYENGNEERAKGNIDFINSDIRILLVTDYTPDAETHRVQSDIPEASQLGEYRLEGKTLIKTKFLADDLEIPSFSSESDITGLVLMSGTDSYDTTVLLAYLTSTDLPITPDGSDITLRWDRTTEGDGILTL